MITTFVYVRRKKLHREPSSIPQKMNAAIQAISEPAIQHSRHTKERNNERNSPCVKICGGKGVAYIAPVLVETNRICESQCNIINKILRRGVSITGQKCTFNSLKKRAMDEYRASSSHLDATTHHGLRSNPWACGSSQRMPLLDREKAW